MDKAKVAFMREDLNNILDELFKLEKEIIESSKRFYMADNNNLYSLDLFAIAVNNRAISLTKAYLSLVKENNYIAAVSLIRLQLDNALRFFASTQVKDSNNFVMHFIDGKEIRDYKDCKGKNLTDSYLAKELDKYFLGTYKLYKDACGYIHLSDKHFFPTVSKIEEQKRTFSFVIGSSDNYTEAQKIDFSKTMLEVTKLVIIMVEQWKHEKVRIGNMRQR